MENEALFFAILACGSKITSPTVDVELRSANSINDSMKNFLHFHIGFRQPLLCSSPGFISFVRHSSLNCNLPMQSLLRRADTERVEGLVKIGPILFVAGARLFQQ